MTRKFIQFEVTPKMHQAIRSTCAEMCVSISQFMREAAGVYLNLGIFQGEKVKDVIIDTQDKMINEPLYPLMTIRGDKDEQTMYVRAASDIDAGDACIISKDTGDITPCTTNSKWIGYGALCPNDQKKGSYFWALTPYAATKGEK